MPAQIALSATFKDNLKQLPPVDALTRIDLESLEGTALASIENQPGKQGSLAVYNYLARSFDVLDADAAGLGLALFAEHTADARSRPGAHPNVDRLLEIAAGGTPLNIRVIGGGN
jgi:hypothetical protein